MILVNEKKVVRAKEILSYIAGKAKNDEERALADKFSEMIKTDKVKESDQLEYIYTKLGGFVRTEAEQKVAEAKAKEMKKKYEAKKSHDDED